MPALHQYPASLQVRSNTPPQSLLSTSPQTSLTTHNQIQSIAFVIFLILSGIPLPPHPASTSYRLISNQLIFTPLSSQIEKRYSFQHRWTLAYFPPHDSESKPSWSGQRASLVTFQLPAQAKCGATQQQQYRTMF